MRALGGDVTEDAHRAGAAADLGERPAGYQDQQSLRPARVADDHLDVVGRLALQGAHQANLDAEADSFGALFASEDAKEGMTAFVEKREANFVGR